VERKFHLFQKSYHCQDRKTDAHWLGEPKVSGRGIRGSRVTFFAVLSEDILLNDCECEAFVRAQIISQSSCRSNYVFIPDTQNLARKGILAAHAIISGQDEFIPVRIIKPEFGRVILKKGLRLGQLESLNEGDGFYEDVRVISQQVQKKEDI
jgi:hypothetical protein